MAVVGIKAERTLGEVPEFVIIDLQKHTDFIPHQYMGHDQDKSLAAKWKQIF